MESAVMEEVLKEILQQQKALAAANEKEQEARQEIFLKLEEFDKKLSSIKLPANDASTILIPVKRWIEEVRTELEKQPKTVVQEKRIQVFPDWPVEVYRSIFKGLMIMIVVIYALVVINRYAREGEYLHYKKAWQNLYSQQKEDFKMVLDKVWNESK